MSLSLRNLKMPDLGNWQLPEIGDASSIIIMVGIVIILYLIFRKLIKMAIFVMVVILLLQYLA